MLVIGAFLAVCPLDNPVRHVVLSLGQPALSTMLSSGSITPTPPTVATVLPTPIVIPTPTPIPIATATPSPTPTPTPTPNATPTPTRTVDEVRAILTSLKDQALSRSTSGDRDARLNIVVIDAVYHGQYDIALDAAKQGGYKSTKSSMLVYVAGCMAREGWYEQARNAADDIPYAEPQKTVREEIFSLEHQSLRNILPPVCRQVPWLRAPP